MRAAVAAAACEALAPPSTSADTASTEAASRAERLRRDDFGRAGRLHTRWAMINLARDYRAGKLELFAPPRKPGATARSR